MTTRREENAICAGELRARFLRNLNGCRGYELEGLEKETFNAWTLVWEEWIAAAFDAIDRARDLEEQATMSAIVDADPREGDLVGTCRGCGKPVIWVAITKKDGTRGRLPLDARAPVYQVDPDHAYPEEHPHQNAVRQKGAYVSHYATCKNANDFSQSRRKKTDA